MDVGDQSNTTCSLTEVQTTEDIVLFFLSVILATMTVLMNSSIIVVIVKTKLLQTCTNTFIVSLATAEILFGGFGLIFAGLFRICSYIAVDTFMCASIAFIQTLGRSAAILNMMLICVDRAVAVAKPLKYMQIITPRRSVGLIIYSWVQSTVISIMPFLGAGQYSYSSKYSMCLFQTHPSGGHIAKEMLNFIFPSSMILICVSVIVKQVRRHHRVFAIVPIPTHRNVDVRQNISFSGRSTLKSMRAFFLSIVGYGVLRFPFFVLHFMNYVDPLKVNSFNIQMTMWISYMYCILNPMVITLSNKPFKSRFIAIFLCGTSKVKPNNEFTRAAGLHGVLDAAMIACFIQQKDRTFQKHIIYSKTQLGSAELLLRLSTAQNPVTYRSNVRSITDATTV